MKKFIIFGLFAAFIGFAFADDIADRQTATSLTYVNDELSTRQDKIGAQSGTQVATFTNTAGGIAPREIKSDLGNNTNDTALPTVSAVNDGLSPKQDTLGANKHADYVATYTNTPGALGEKGIYQDSGTYATQQNNLVDAGTFNAALQNGLDNEFVCANRPDAYDPATGNCWLWEIDNTGSRSYISASGTSAQNGIPTPESPIYPIFYQQGNMVLRKVGNYADSYDATTHKITRRVGVKVLKGTEYWSRQTATSNRFQFFLTNRQILHTMNVAAICSHFKNIITSTSGAVINNQMALVRVTGDSTQTTKIVFEYDNIQTIDEWKQFLADQYAAGTPVTVYYPLAIPIEENWTESTYRTDIYLPQNQ